VLRPCILWNDVRSAKECHELVARLTDMPRITGNPTLPGFTAPKLVWVKKHEPEIFARVAKVLLPKAYLRYRLSGEFIEDMSDASGTGWLDVGKRAWSKAALEATDLSLDHMPALVEGTAPAGRCAGRVWRKRWGMTQPPVIAGARVTMRRARSRWEPSSQAMRSFRSAPPACCGRRRPASRPTPRRRSMPSAIACRTPGTRWVSSCRQRRACPGCPAWSACGGRDC
jgi:hypothetical protein